MSRDDPETVEAGVLEGGLWGVKIRWPGGDLVDGMLTETARRLADKISAEGHADLAEMLRRAAPEADQHDLTSDALYHEMTKTDDVDLQKRFAARL